MSKVKSYFNFAINEKTPNIIERLSRQFNFYKPV